MAEAARRKAQRSAARVRMLLVLDALGGWLLPLGGVGTAVILYVLTATGVVPVAPALAGAILAVLVALVYFPLEGLGRPGRSRRQLVVSLAVAGVWLVGCFLPFYRRLFPPPPLLRPTVVSAEVLPLRIPQKARGVLEIEVEGDLPAPGAAGVSPPLHYRLTLATQGGRSETIAGTFTDTRRSRARRAGRRAHASATHLLDVGEGGELTLTAVSTEPATAPPLTVTIRRRGLPPMWLLGAAAALLTVVAIAFDWAGPTPESDGALTMATGAALTTAYVLWTGGRTHVQFGDVVGYALLGGLPGTFGGWLVWWVAKHLLPEPPAHG